MIGLFEKNAVLNENAKEITKIEKILVILIFLFELNPSLASFNVIQYSLLALLAFFATANGGVRLNSFLKWFGVFCVYSFFSFAWAVNVDRDVIGTLLLMVKILIVFLFLSNRKINFSWLLNAFIFVNLLDVIILLLNMDFTPLFVYGHRIGHPVIWGATWGINSICPMFAMGASFAGLLMLCPKRLYLRIFYFAVMVIEMLPVMFLGSRQSMLIFAIALLFFIFFNSKLTLNAVIKRLLFISFIAVFFLVLLSMDIFRTSIIDRFIASLNSSSESDSERLRYISSGIEFFLDRPILGNGLNNFHVLMGWSSGYSHNTFIEVLSGLGLIGFIVFHSFVPVFFVLFSKNKDRWVRNVSFAFCLLFFVFEFVIITYTAFHLMFLVWLSFSLLESGAKKPALSSNREIFNVIA